MTKVNQKLAQSYVKLHKHLQNCTKLPKIAHIFQKSAKSRKIFKKPCKIAQKLTKIAQNYKNRAQT